MWDPWVFRCWAKGKKQERQRRQEGQRQRQIRRKKNKDEKDRDKDKKGKGKANAKAAEYFAGYCLLCKAWRHMKDCWWNEGTRSGKGPTSLENPITPFVDATTGVPITGMLLQSDDGETVPADPTQWLCSVTKREPSCEDFLIDSEAATSVCQRSLTAWRENPEDLEWKSDRPLDISSRRPSTRRLACAHETVSTWR